jgi:hypothetical protein
MVCNPDCFYKLFFAKIVSDVRISIENMPVCCGSENIHPPGCGTVDYRLLDRIAAKKKPELFP